MVQISCDRLKQSILFMNKLPSNVVVLYDDSLLTTITVLMLMSNGIHVNIITSDIEQYDNKIFLSQIDICKSFNKDLVSWDNINTIDNVYSDKYIRRQLQYYRIRTRYKTLPIIGKYFAENIYTGYNISYGFDEIPFALVSLDDILGYISTSMNKNLVIPYAKNKKLNQILKYPLLKYLPMYRKIYKRFEFNLSQLSIVMPVLI